MFNSAADYVASLGVGLNSDSCKTRPSRRAVQANPDYYEKFYDRGFRHIRLRTVNDITYDQLDDKGVLVGGNQLLEEIRIAVNRSLIAGLLPVVSYGSGPLEESVTPENEEKFFQWWVKCSDYLSDQPNSVAFNLMIEIGGELQKNPEVVNRCYAKVIKYIRQTQRDRIIFCAPVMLSEPRKLKNLYLPLPDPFLGVEVHDAASGVTKDKTSLKYWDESNPDPAVREANRQRFRDTLDVAIAWRALTNVPVWWGAIMTNPYNKDSFGTYTPEEQAVFAAFFMDEAKKRGVPVAWNSDSKFINMETMDFLPEQKVVLNAITGVVL